MTTVTDKLGFGGASLTSMQSEQRVLRLLNMAFEMGIRHFDTAPLYGRGYSEMLLGTFLKGKRDKLTLTTKFGLGNYETGKIPPVLALPLNYYKKKFKGIKQHQPQKVADVTYTALSHRDITRAEIETSLTRSLQRLKTDYIDYYLLHEGIPSFLNDETKTYLLQLKQKGIVKNIGIATDSFNISRLNTVDLKDWDVLQYDFNANESDSLVKRFPDHKHFIHSALKFISSVSLPQISEQEKGGYLLAECADKSKADKVLFSTRRISILKNNLGGFNEYYKN
ncbi:MAG: aldo/keto reductase [Bacteroidetes bacterium]|nr:aldo/keto reductase [Bacteroidota bacterium]